MGKSQEERGEYWNSYYSSKAVPDIPSQFAAFALSECRDADYFLDVGCGNGRDSFFFARRGMAVVSVDGSTAAIDDIADRAKTAQLPITALSSACEDPTLMDKGGCHGRIQNVRCWRDLCALLYARDCGNRASRVSGFLCRIPKAEWRFKRPQAVENPGSGTRQPSP